jgi:hypothetical protein
MAKKSNKKSNPNSTSSTEVNLFTKGMSKDVNASFQGKETWYHAINAYNNSVDGDVGVIGNEPANLECAKIPYTIIGTIHKQGDEWYIFSTDDVNSEIGLFNDSECAYTTIVNAPCLSFNRKYLITGASKENFDCTWQVYWDDNLNPSRTLNVDDIPWIQTDISTPGSPCKEYQDTINLDCEKIRLAPLVKTPCVKLTKAQDGGQIVNGSYQAFIAYALNGQKVTDYIGISNIQSLFDHSEFAGSLNITIENLDQRFEEFELVILSNTKNQYVAKRIGLYSTAQTADPSQTSLLPKVISLDFIDPALTSTPFPILFKKSPAYEKSEAMYVVNDWLIRQGPTEQFDFNYQPIANLIKTEWVVAQYPASYYFKGGNKTSFMRDEQYAFFIRWIYNTGERSASYHIPGRPPRTTTSFPIPGSNQFGEPINETDDAAGINCFPTEMNFQAYNTATILTSNTNIPIGDGGTIIATGDMGYWESTERYPATKPEIWDSTYINPNTGVNLADTTDTRYDLCGQPIRHHKMPTEELSPFLHLSTTDGQNIRILGVQFKNIKRPKYNDGSYIENIVGYEVLRGSREGAKSILAKGIFRNMREYTIPDAEDLIGGNVQGIYPNYPYNDLDDDQYFQNDRVKTIGCHGYNDSIFTYAPLQGYRQDAFTFHSPELMFKRPFLSARETRIYGTLHGQAEGQFIPSEKHPKNKLIRNGAIIIASIIGVGYALQKIRGKVTKKSLPLQMNNQGFVGPATYNFPFGLNQYGAATGIVSTPFTVLPELPAHMPGTGGGAGATAVAMTAAQVAIQGTIQGLIAAEEGGKFAAIGDGGETTTSLYETLNTARIASGQLPGTFGAGLQIDIEESEQMGGPIGFRNLTGFTAFLAHFMIGTDEIIELFYNLISLNNFAYKHNSHGQYTTFQRTIQSDDNYRRKNIDANYIGSSFQTFGETSSSSGLFKINNLFRPDTVAINTDGILTDPRVIDNSRYTLGELGDPYLLDPTLKVKRPISCLYGALKFDFENQYGQLEGIKQVQMRGCVEYVDPSNPDGFLYSTEPLFSGDVYINRYTEKTIMPIFTDFMYGQPDETIYDYLKKINIPYPRYWMNTEKYQISKLIDGFLNGTLFATFTNSNTPTLIPEDLFYLDRHASSCGAFLVQQTLDPDGIPVINNNPDPNPIFAMRFAYMYTHVNGIQDFFVESELNIAQRDWEDIAAKRHYDPYLYTSIKDLFHADIIKDDNFYKYDSPLSASRFITNLQSYGNVQLRDYDPQIAETCFTFYPKRLIYSLQARKETRKDFWRVFLPNNFKDFKDKVNVIKPINKSGAIIFFPYRSPQMFQGLDTLRTDLGTKLTIGDGGLFSQPFQNLVNADLANEYGSCESARSVVNTPLGIFYLSQAQGKVFQYGRSLTNIANNGMKWWFNKYLPSILLREFPELAETELGDNPVVGVGCQSVYDTNNDIVYFMKKDYSVIGEYKTNIQFDINDCQFYFYPDGCNTSTCRFPITLGDITYFNDASWTVSYDPKANAWISFHDWHPELVMPSINHFLTTKTEPTDPTEPYCPPGYIYNPQTGDCESLVTETVPGFAILEDNIQTITISDCPPGYTLNQLTNICEGLTTDVTVSPITYLVAPIVKNPVFGIVGTRFYNGAFGTGPFISTTASTDLFDSNNNPVAFNLRPKGSILNDPWWRRLRDGGVWTTQVCPSLGGCPSACGSFNCTNLPCCEWIGFITCVNITESKEYCFLIAADNAVRVFVDGNLFADLNFSANVTFQRMHVIPIFLTAGTHSITMEGFNNDQSGGFVGEIYNLTLQEAQDTNIIGSEFDLINYRLWSSRQEQQFNTGQFSGNTCPPGYSLVFSADCGELMCVQIANPEVTCGCEPGYTIVYPEILPNLTPVWTQETGPCSIDVEISPAIPAVDPGPGPIPLPDPPICPVDIVFVMQADDSTVDIFAPEGDTQRERMIDFVRGFIVHPTIQAALNAGTLQFGVTLAAMNFDQPNCQIFQPFVLNPNGHRNDRYNFQFGSGGNEFMTSTEPSTGLNPTSLATSIVNWMYTYWFGNSTNPPSTRRPDYGQRWAKEEVIYKRNGNSQLGDRSSNPNYKAFIIHVTSQVNDWYQGGCVPACFTNSQICIPNLNGDPTLDSIVVMLGSVPPQNSAEGSDNCGLSFNPKRNWLAPLNNGNPNSIFGIDNWPPPAPMNDVITTVNNVVAYIESFCPFIPIDPSLCLCYEFVLIASNDVDTDFTIERCSDGEISNITVNAGESINLTCARNAYAANTIGTVTYLNTTPCGSYNCEGTTGTEAVINTYEAICRKIDCGCLPGPTPQTVVEQVGTCDIPNLIYDIGYPSVSLPTITCNYDIIYATPPSNATGGIWRHNYRCDLYANYYGVDYPWEIEFVETTGQMVNTVRSLEYQLEAFVYKGDLINGCGDDRWHDLDFNFDESIIYNTEQVSGLLRLELNPKRDPLAMIQYPIISNTDIRILYSKEEQKYRFNQFWDITKDRGEFFNQSLGVFVEQPIFITQLNGYIKDLNSVNLDYTKDSDQRKKFRHYYNKFLLRRRVSSNRKMMLKINNTKLNLSFR